MKQNLKYLTFIFLIFISCKSQKALSINSNLNEEYIESKKTFEGNLNNEDYTQFINNFERELNTKIPAGKSILINYSQRARNCLFMGFNKNTFSEVINNVIKISNTMSKEHNAVDFFVYSENVFNKEIFEEKKKYQPDSGFFYNNIFTLHENCEAFFILKPNGDFLKYYGEDYFTKVKNFLNEE